MKRYRVEILLALITVVTSVTVWWKPGVSQVLRYWDGPSYLHLAAVGYDTPTSTAHLPLYPLAIRGLGFLLGVEWAMLVVSVLSAAAAAIVFYRLCRDDWHLPAPEYLATAFLVLPPRWLVVRSVGASESLFLLLALLSIAFWNRRRLGWACAFGGLMAITRPSGVLVLASYLGLLLWRRRSRRDYLWLLLIPAPLMAFLWFCHARFGNFFAPYEPNLDQIAIIRPFPNLEWFLQGNLVAHAEFHILLAVLYGVALVRSWQFPSLFSYGLVQLGLVLMLFHEDWSRYFLAALPVAVVGYQDLLRLKAVRWIIVPAAFVFGLIYAWGSIPKNLCPIDLYRQLVP